MRRSLVAVVLVLPALFAGVWLVVGGDQVTSIATRVDRSVVRVYAVGPQGFTSGTGFVVSSGVVVTNFHVVRMYQDKSWNIVVADRVADEELRRPASVLEAFPGEDLAVLSVEGLDRPPVTFAGTGDRAKGIEVLAMGFPGAADRLGPTDEASLVRGAVSRTFSAPWTAGGPTIEIIQHTAPTNPGNSGGPLVDSCGHVVGVNSQREAQVVRGPGGIPLVIDLIQGVFYASDADVLTSKLQSSKIAFAQATRRCGTGLVGALQKSPSNMLAVGAIILAITGLGLLLRRRALVQVVVYCGDTINACAQAVERAVQNIRSRYRSGAAEISVRAGRAPSSHEPKPEA